MTQSSFTESFLLDFTWGYFFPHILRIVPKFPSSDSTKNSDFKPLNWKNCLTLGDEYTHRKAIAQNVSLQVSLEDVSSLTSSLRTSLNIPSQILQRQNFETGQHRVSINSVKWMHISESRFLERFFLNFISVYFTIHHSPQCALKYHTFGFTGTVYQHYVVRKEV